MKISILSSDVLFARMLMLEIEGIRKGHSVKLNDHDFSDGDSLIILDLDSPYASGVFECENIIGFSRNEKSVSAENAGKCKILLHRPFLVSKFLEEVERFDTNATPIEKPEQEERGPRLCFLRDGLITLDGRGIHLSQNEYALLSALYERMGEPLSRDEIGKILSSSDGNITDVYVCKLRAKLESGGAERLIYTVRSKGYMLKIK